METIDNRGNAGSYGIGGRGPAWGIWTLGPRGEIGNGILTLEQITNEPAHSKLK
jgi:hypothetical protein